MAYLLDTSVLTRLINLTDVQHTEATEAVRKLFAAGEELHITAQNIIEFWAVATRPIAVNGLGLPIVTTAAQVAQFRNTFVFLEDAPNVFQAWQLIVIGANVEGKQTHDARLAAVAHAYNVPHILTFNDRHFQRFVQFGVTPINPRNV